MLRSGSADATREVGRRLGASVREGDVLTLAGPFGAGKTTLVQGLALGLGVGDPVSSPSFAIVHEYQPEETGARVPLFHLDLYRLRDPVEVLDLDLDQYFARGVVVVEWPESALPVLPDDRLELQLALDGDERRIAVLAPGSRGRTLVEALRPLAGAP